MYPSTIVSQILAYHFLITTAVFPVFILKNSNFYSLSYPMWTTINCFTNLLLFLTLLCIYFLFIRLIFVDKSLKFFPCMYSQVPCPVSLHCTPHYTYMEKHSLQITVSSSSSWFQSFAQDSVSHRSLSWPLCFPFTPSDLVLLILFTYYVFSITVMIKHIH